MRFWIITTNILTEGYVDIEQIEARDRQAVRDLLDEQADTYDSNLVLDEKQYEKLKEKLGCF